ncbi:hypothetical protein [Nocardiopsis sp. MG754419]|uniref:hypothetical protein n=1 Tax=Nocardiopsis sp. MG754419 TaxID=2259865 RepID=UPI001BA58EF2|nr:hypothetical protein [Nocardiopsis sp. MG754419]MBR8740791.1 hypothetical protein [Nocardiopsis sp. MG754419]
MPDKKSSLDGVMPWEWDQDTSVSLEVADNYIAYNLAKYADLIESERSSPQPDQEKIQRWKSIIDQTHQDSKNLTPRAPRQIEEILRRQIQWRFDETA